MARITSRRIRIVEKTKDQIPERKRSTAEELTEAELGWPVFLVAERRIFFFFECNWIGKEKIRRESKEEDWFLSHQIGEHRNND